VSEMTTIRLPQRNTRHGIPRPCSVLPGFIQLPWLKVCSVSPMGAN
jgi:hypothetical protein